MVCVGGEFTPSMVAHLSMVGHGISLVLQNALVGDEGEGKHLTMVAIPHLSMVGHSISLVLQNALVGDEGEGKNLVVIKRTRRLSGQLPSSSVGEWCAYRQC